MGCKQGTTKPPPLVFSRSPTVPSTTPVYVKSALKKSEVKGKGKTEKRTAAKRNPSTVSKSVNFNENVQIKPRTPTPKQIRYENMPKTTEPERSLIDDDELSSISSQEDLRNERIKPTTPPNPPSQRSQLNGSWQKNNSVAALPAKTRIQETILSPPPITTMATNPAESPTILAGNHFRVRRKVPHSVIPQPSNSVDPNQSPTIPVQQSPVQSVPFLIQRPLVSTNAILIEHPASLPPDTSSSRIAYYSFSRRPTGKQSSTKK